MITTGPAERAMMGATDQRELQSPVPNSLAMSWHSVDCRFSTCHCGIRWQLFNGSQAGHRRISWIPCMASASQYAPSLPLHPTFRQPALLCHNTCLCGQEVDLWARQRQPIMPFNHLLKADQQSELQFQYDVANLVLGRNGGFATNPASVHSSWGIFCCAMHAVLV